MIKLKQFDLRVTNRKVHVMKRRGKNDVMRFQMNQQHYQHL